MTRRLRQTRRRRQTRHRRQTRRRLPRVSITSLTRASRQAMPRHRRQPMTNHFRASPHRPRPRRVRASLRPVSYTHLTLPTTPYV